MLVMRSHPTGAVHVADLMDSVLPSRMARQVTREIYDYSGVRQLLSIVPHGPPHPLSTASDGRLLTAATLRVRGDSCTDDCSTVMTSATG